MPSKMETRITMAAAQGERIAGFILITGIEGTRYAVRQHAVAVIHDADGCPSTIPRRLILSCIC
jgi:hypothetical protein